MDFKVSKTSNICRARTGTIKSRGNTLNTPCILLDTVSGLPTYLTPNQVRMANLPKHGYCINISDLLS